MAKHLASALLVLGLAPLPGALHAQTVDFYVCNAGDATVDVFFSQDGKGLTQTVAPAECTELAHSKDEMAPGMLGFGVADARHPWRGVTRLGLLPAMGGPVLKRTEQTRLLDHEG